MMDSTSIVERKGRVVAVGAGGIKGAFTWWRAWPTVHALSAV